MIFATLKTLFNIILAIWNNGFNIKQLKDLLTTIVV